MSDFSLNEKLALKSRCGDSIAGEALAEIERLQRENEQARKRVKELKEGHRQYDERCRRLEAMLDRLAEMCDEQANDEGLWFIADTAPEAYLQQELRELHAVIEQYAASHRRKDDE